MPGFSMLCVVLAIILPVNPAMTTPLKDLTSEQADVWRTLEAYTEASHQRDLDKYLSFWHEDFIGWHDGDARPTNKKQRESGLGYYFSMTESLEYELEPLAILVVAGGRAAVVHYVLRNVLLTTADGKKEPGTSYWTDFLVKEDGRWLLIGDHGGAAPKP